MDAVQRPILTPLGFFFVASGIVFAVLLLALDISFAAHQPGLSINGHAIWGRDFVNLWSGGRLWLEGRTGLIYDIAQYQAWQLAALGPGIASHNYSYPPISLFYAPLFGALPYLAALALFLLVSAAAFALAARRWLAAEGLQWWWALLLPSSLVCLWTGQYGLLIAALWCAAWSKLDRQPVLAGIATGLLLIKPHMAVLMPLLFIRRRAWRAFAAAAVTVIVLIALSMAVFGPDMWRTYLTATSGAQLAMVDNVDTLFGWMMSTWATMLVAWGWALGPALAVQAVIAAVVVAALLWRLPDDPIRAGALAAVATFLVLPYAFNYDLPAVGVAALLFLTDASRRGNRGEAIVAGLAIMIPSAMVWLAALHVRVAPIVLTALFALMWRRWALLPGRSRLAVALGT